MIIIKSTGLSSRVGVGDFWSDLAKGATSFYRAVNPFVGKSGEILNQEQIAVEFTQMYRDINPFVTDTGALIKSTGDLGREFTQTYRALNPFLDTQGVSTIEGIDMELGKSPFWREWGGTIAIVGLTAISGGLLAPLATIGISGSLATAVVGAVAGIGASAVQSSINEYSVKVEKQGIENAVNQYTADINNMKKLQANLDETEALRIQLAIDELEKTKNSATLKAVAQKTIPVIGALAVLYFMTGN